MGDKTVSLQKSDFTEYALDLGIWDALTGDKDDIDQVEVRVVRRETKVLNDR